MICKPGGGMTCGGDLCSICWQCDNHCTCRFSSPSEKLKAGRVYGRDEPVDEDVPRDADLCPPA